MGGKVVLSGRLAAAAAYVTNGNRVCDVGCDHGFVSIYLIQQGISPGVLAMDVRKGPLMQAQSHIEEYGLAQYIETRLSDGLDAYQIGEADTLICAGMGGRLMMHVLEAQPDKTASFQELILQPQSEIQIFRRFLREQGYLIADENMIEEDGKFYSIIYVALGKKKKTLPIGESFAWENESEISLQAAIEPGTWQELEDLYGSILIRNRHPVLRRYLEREEQNFDGILEKLQAKGLEDIRRRERYQEIVRLRENCRSVLEMFN